MSEKLKAVRRWVLCEGAIDPDNVEWYESYYDRGDVDEAVLTGRRRGVWIAIPVAIVPMPEDGEIREMWRWKGDASRNYTAEEMERMIAGIGGLGCQRSDFRPITIIDRYVEGQS